MIEVAFTAVPEPIKSLSDTFPLRSKYEPPVAEYMLYLLFGRDAENSRNQQAASSHLQVFTSLLGLKSQVEQVMSPVATGGA